MNNEFHAFKLGPDEIHVWLFDLGDPILDYLLFERILSKEEITRAQHYQSPKDRLRFIARRGILRQLLARYVGIDPDQIIFSTNPYGKLVLSNHPLSFNLSHCQDRIAFAFTLNKDVGVDIEQVNSFPGLSRLVEYWFSIKEQVGFSKLPPDAQLEAFYHIWTQKEAFVKARGKGLSLSLKDFSVSHHPHRPGKLLSIVGEPAATSGWKMAVNGSDAGWKVAVCIRMDASPKVLWMKPDLADIVPGFFLEKVRKW